MQQFVMFPHVPTFLNSLRGVTGQVWAGVQRVKNVAEHQPVDNVQEDEGRWEENSGHAILKISRSHSHFLGGKLVESWKSGIIAESE